MKSQIKAIEDRDYDQEYKRYQGSPKQKKNRAMRNKVRRELERTGRVHKGDGKDVHHKDGNPKNPSTDNLRVKDAETNRSFDRRPDGSEVIDQ